MSYRSLYIFRALANAIINNIRYVILIKVITIMMFPLTLLIFENRMFTMEVEFSSIVSVDFLEGVEDSVVLSHPKLCRHLILHIQ